MRKNTPEEAAAAKIASAEKARRVYAEKMKDEAFAARKREKCREWERANADKVAAKRLARRGVDVAYQAAWRAANKAKAYECERRWRGENIPQCMWNSAKRRASMKGLPFTITVADIVIPDVCPVLGLPFEHNVGCPKDNSPSLDRIDPALGYVPGNIAVISFLANKVKQTATSEQIRRVADYVASHGC